MPKVEYCARNVMYIRFYRGARVSIMIYQGRLALYMVLYNGVHTYGLYEHYVRYEDICRHGDFS